MKVPILGGLPRASLAFPLVLAVVWPAAADEPSVFQLGAVEVLGPGVSAGAPVGASSEILTQQDLQDRGVRNLAQALSEVAGVTSSMTGQRAESQVWIRGFSPQQVTLNVDGIPIYVPYDGNVDLARLLTPGMARIVVTRGLGSLMYGPNNMGGSINVITQAPSGALEGDVSVGGGADGQRGYDTRLSAQLGARLDEHWYLQGAAATDVSSGYPLSQDFQGVAAQPAGDRLRAASNDKNATLKLGFTPNATDEYALGAYLVNSSKQSPPYAGNTARTGQRVAYWDWPQWDKQSVYFIGNTAVGDGYLKTRLYRDGFINRLNAFDNANYTTTARPYAFLSKYDDYSNGGSLELGQPIGAHNLLKLAAFVKDDVHRETQFPTAGNPYVSPWLHFHAHTESLGFEDVWAWTEATKVQFGYRYDRHGFDQAEQYATSHNTGVTPMVLGPAESADNGQVVLTHDLGGAVLRAGVGSKTRFPGIKDVYSYRLGQGIPNPALGPEHALERELGVSGHLGGSADYDLSVYVDSVRDAIAFVTVSPGLGQNQNVGTAVNRGADFTLHCTFDPAWLGTLRYSYLDSRLGRAGLLATNAPRSSGGASLSWLASAGLELAADLDAASSRQTSTNGLQAVGGYAVANFRLIGHPSRQLTVTAGIYNLFDRNYALTEGFPMPGRTLQADADWHF
ncbi:MAG: TonB-dependent receptor [Pseudomonadota bacterium]|nr:TonB-dependent receptor [Pseudomonadota bacterium]